MTNRLGKIIAAAIVVQGEVMLMTPSLLEQLKEVRTALQVAQAKFNEASGQAEVDAAIYEWKAAEIRYQDLLKQCRQEGITIPFSAKEAIV